MAANRIIDRNPAYQVNYKLVIPGFDEVEYGIQTTELPGLNMAGVETPYQNNQGVIPSNRIEYDPLNFTFMVDQQYENHSTLRLWMAKIKHTEPVISQLKDVSLHVLDSNKQSVRRFVFFGAFPTMLGPLPLESAVGETTPVLCTAMFRYQFYDEMPLT